MPDAPTSAERRAVKKIGEAGNFLREGRKQGRVRVCMDIIARPARAVPL